MADKKKASTPAKKPGKAPLKKKASTPAKKPSNNPKGRTSLYAKTDRYQVLKRLPKGEEEQAKTLGECVGKGKPIRIGTKRLTSLVELVSPSLQDTTIGEVHKKMRDLTKSTSQNHYCDNNILGWLVKGGWISITPAK